MAITPEEREYYRNLLKDVLPAPDPLGTRRFPREPQPPKLSLADEARALLQECKIALILDEVGKIRPDANTTLLAKIEAFLKRTGG